MASPSRLCSFPACVVISQLLNTCSVVSVRSASNSSASPPRPTLVVRRQPARAWPWRCCGVGTSCASRQLSWPRSSPRHRIRPTATLLYFSRRCSPSPFSVRAIKFTWTRSRRRSACRQEIPRIG
uniref:Uncharacterized protein n=1 Tax=Zea mays TaxID=4577 RepID=B4FA38_MAIZE|nr:unknown [Zea mays]|eukprot:NP_001130672.1 uncharacterized protein LOC100191775 [Zea mays]